MTLDGLLVLGAVVLALAGLVLGWLAHKGRVPWGWAVGLVAAGLGLLGLRRPQGPRHPTAGAPPPMPRPEPARMVVEPILAEADEQAEAELAKIMEANEDDSRLDRLDRLANLNDKGRDR